MMSDEDAEKTRDKGGNNALFGSDDEGEEDDLGIMEDDFTGTF